MAFVNRKGKALAYPSVVIVDGREDNEPESGRWIKVDSAKKANARRRRNERRKYYRTAFVGREGDVISHWASGTPPRVLWSAGTQAARDAMRLYWGPEVGDVFDVMVGKTHWAVAYSAGLPPLLNGSWERITGDLEGVFSEFRRAARNEGLDVELVVV